jgi:dTDP-4-dehydrorhamnose reductase
MKCWNPTFKKLLYQKNSMKVLIFGGSGMLGHKLSQKMSGNFEVFSTIRENFNKYRDLPIFEGVNIIPQINIENINLVEKTIKNLNPNVVINAIGVIKQLPDAKNNVKTLTINSLFPHQLAAITAENNIRLINISTDCVFNGKKGDYTEEDFPDAEDLYGKSKNLGEVTQENCLTLRTSIIGRELFTSHSLVEWFLSNRGKKVKGFVNAIYTGFPTLILAEILTDIITNHQELSGLFHVSSKKINKFDLLQLINKAFKADIEIEPDTNFQIDRSLDSTKFRKITGFQPHSWEEMIKIMAEDARIYDTWRK